MSLKSGHEISAVTGKTKELCSLFTGRSESVQLNPGNWIFNDSIAFYGDKFYDFKFYEDDVVVSTMPKSGTTWMQEIIWTLRNNLNLDNSQAERPIAARCPVMDADFAFHHLKKPTAVKREVQSKCPDYDENQGLYIKLTEILPRPRNFKFHLGLSLLPSTVLDKTKVVYVIRDPRDVCVSQFYHCRLFTYHNFIGTLDQYVDAFIGGAVFWGPYWSHVSDAWKRRNHPNLHITFYEKLKKNPFEEYKRLTEFLGVNATDEQIEKVIKYTSFEEMKKRDNHLFMEEDSSLFMRSDIIEQGGGFFRTGTSGGWKNSLTEEQKERFEDWIGRNCPDEEIMKNIRGE